LPGITGITGIIRPLHEIRNLKKYEVNIFLDIRARTFPEFPEFPAGYGAVG
jgi:hypothetical protein